MGWEERMIEAEDREAAREVFYEWAAMLQDTRDSVELVGTQNDVVRFKIDTVGNYQARNLMINYGITGRSPLRAIRLDGVGDGLVAIEMLLAELELNRPLEDA